MRLKGKWFGDVEDFWQEMVEGSVPDAMPGCQLKIFYSKSFSYVERHYTEDSGGLQESEAAPRGR